MGFGLACAPVRCAHPSFWVHYHAKRGAARPPAHRSFAASYSTTKSIYNLSNLGRPCQGLFSFHWNMRSPATRPAHCSFADPSGNIFGVKLCTDATIRPNFFGFSFFLISSYSSLLILLFLFHLILLVGAILHLILLFLYLNCLSPPLPLQLRWSLRIFRENPAKIPVWQKIR